MFKKNIKTTQLARDIDLPQQTLQRIVSGTSLHPHINTLKPIADFFNITIEQLKGERPLPNSLSDIYLATNEKPQAQQLPVILWEEIDKYLNNPDIYAATDSSIFVDSSSGQKTFALILNDSSMEPYFPKGGLLVLDPEKSPNDRNFVLAKIADNGIFLFRQLLIDGEYQYLKPLNPDLGTFPMRPLKENDKIIGIMTEFRHIYIVG